ncbi:MAG: hypothetical protein IJS32_06215 [Kiritimatiellae bacterium]|nr:hypothetical protein [Kiritimatiellia bacterium]
MTKALQKPVVYLETTFVSRLTGWLSPLDHIWAQQVATREWWRLMRARVEAVVSEVVWFEIALGDAACAARRARTIDGLPVWEATPESKAVAKELLRTGAVNPDKPRDAAHIAVASIGGADILLSWNFKDIVNENKLPLVTAVVEGAGFRCPLITSPDKLLEDLP